MKQYRIPAGSSYWVNRERDSWAWESIVARKSLHEVIYTEDEVLKIGEGDNLPSNDIYIYFRLPKSAHPRRIVAFRKADVIDSEIK